MPSTEEPSQSVIHQDDKGLALAVLGEHLLHLFQGVEAGYTLLVRHFLGEEAALDDVHPGPEQAVDDELGVLKAKLAVVAVAPVPEGAVQYADLLHWVSPFPNCSW